MVLVFRPPSLYGFQFRPLLVIPPALILEKQKIICPKCKGEGVVEVEKKKLGVIIQHGCGQSIFLSKKTLEDVCMIVCSYCKQSISLSLFGSSLKQQLLKECREYSEEEIKKILSDINDKEKES